MTRRRLAELPAAVAWTARRLAFARRAARACRAAGVTLDLRAGGSVHVHPGARVVVGDGPRGGTLTVVCGEDVVLGPRFTLWLARPGGDARLDLGDGAVLDEAVRVELSGDGHVRLGPRCDVRRLVALKVAGTLTHEGHGTLAQGATLHADERVTLELGASVGEYVTVVDSDHSMAPPGDDTPFLDRPVVTAPVRIGRSAWVGAQAVVTAGVTIGAHAVVGAGAVVTSDVAERGVVGGVPARPLSPDRGGPGRAAR